jgi:hypothetical protein
MVRRKHVYITEVFCFLNLSTAQVAVRLVLQQWFVIHYEISGKSGLRSYFKHFLWAMLVAISL